MSDALYSVVWYPATRSVEATRFAERALPARDALVLHRRRSPNLALGLSYAELGADLVPAQARPTSADGFRLLWIPILPSRCLLAARGQDGVVRITDRPDRLRDPKFSDVLEHLETECVCAFEEAFSAAPDAAELAQRLESATELAIDALVRFAAHAPPAVQLPGDVS
jgi:hypothetical protein